MTVSNLHALEKLFLRDNSFTLAEGRVLISSTRDGGGFDAVERDELLAFAERNADKFVPGAYEAFLKLVAAIPLGPTGGVPAPAPATPVGPPVAGPVGPPAPLPVSPDEVIREVKGPTPETFDDDATYLTLDGHVRGEAGPLPYVRGYDSIKSGPLRNRNGSPAPTSSVLTPAEQSRQSVINPGKGLDEAARLLGVPVGGFDKMASSTDFYNPGAEYWWGKCHAWSWSALSEKVNQLVDVAGPENQRGVWIAGQWISRADLGNWMMAVSDVISQTDGAQMFDTEVSPSDLIHGTAQFLMNKGGGVVVDVFNDKRTGKKEVWNQPFVSSDVTTQTLTGSTSDRILAQARLDGIVGGTQVKRVNIVGSYGVERYDGYEGESARSSKTWNLYAVTDASGKMLGSYMADDPKLSQIDGVDRQTDYLPDWLWKPNLDAIDDVLAGRTNPAVESDAHGREFKFFVGTVLARGVPGAVRAAFEAEAAALPVGTLAPATVSSLQQKYPGIANAYSPEQWGRAFASRGLDSQAFGAIWKTPAA